MPVFNHFRPVTLMVGDARRVLFPVYQNTGIGVWQDCTEINPHINIMQRSYIPIIKQPNNPDQINPPSGSEAVFHEDA
jgi:hypothetical protein